MNPIDRARIALAAERYNFWLDYRGVRCARRRDLKRELRANLAESADHVGAGAAIAAVGPTRRLAAEVTADATGPRWSTGAAAAAAGFGLVLWLQVLAALNFMQGVLATEPSGEVAGGLVPFPGSSVTATVDPGTFAFSIAFGWTSLVVALGAFLIGARPWRLAGRRDQGTASAPMP